MADQKISELTAITGANTADDDLLVIVDTSTGETKKITKAELTTTINNALIDGAPATLDTLNELAAALADDANFASTVTNSLAGKVDTTGDSMTGNLAFGDNDKAIFGAGSDLQIYHDGSNSVIHDAGTGNLLLRAGSYRLNSADNSDNMIRAVDGGAVTLYNAGVAKLATTSTGIDVTGTATMDGLTVDNTASNGVTINASDNLTTNYPLKVQNAAGSGRLELSTYGINNNIDLKLQTQGTNAIYIDTNKDISFYEDTGTTAKFFWDASAESLGIGTTTVDSILHLSKSDATSYNAAATDGQVGVGPTIYLENSANSNATVGGQIVFGMRSTEEQARIGATGGTSPALTFGTADAERMRITSAGNVGIGTASPANDSGYHALTVNGSTGGQVTFKSSDVTVAGILGNSSKLDLTAAGARHIQFNTNAAERMRIDSSGNLLVGKSSGPNYNAVGVDITPLGEGQFTGDSQAVLQLNRQTTDGDIAVFRKDGATVGSIGTPSSSNFAIEANRELLLESNRTRTTQVYLGDGGSSTDSQLFPLTSNVSLGRNGNSWKDLYLSGGVYLGGTGAANHLDDYEEGTFTPTLESTGISGNGKYVKIGKVVHYDISFSSNSGISGHNGVITGLPFTSVSSEYPSNGHIGRLYGVTLSNKDYILRAYNYELTIGYIGGDNTLQGFTQTSTTVRIGISATIQTN